MAGPHSDHSLPPKPRKSGRHGSKMQRADSGFVESYALRRSIDTGRSSLTNGDSNRPSFDRCSPSTLSAANLSRRLDKVVTENSAANDASHSSDRRKSEGRRPSVVSSIKSTATKPRRSRPSSHQSSHRPVLINKPTRPKLPSSQTMPSASTRDVDDVLALHHRSCTLFRSISTTAPPASYATASGMASPSAVSLPCQANEIPDEEDYAHVHIPAITIHWTSPGTRRREYEEIDKSCRGLRGLFSKMRPRWCAAPKPTRFYDADDKEDGGSVRRYRLDLPEEEEGEEDGFGVEKRDEMEGGSTVELSKSKRTPERQGTVKRWGCF